MKLTSMMLYNAAVKVAGNVVTFKTYSETQSHGYIAAKEGGQNKIVAAAELMKEFLYIMNLGTSKAEQIEFYSKKVEWLLLGYELDSSKKERFIKSCRRAKSRIFDLIACNVDKHKDYEGNKVTTKFLTLTFAENMQDLEMANGEITKFLKRLSYQVYGTNKNVIKYLCVPELQKRGAWHYHIVLFNLKYVIYTKLLKVWGSGGVYINALKKGLNSTTVAKYVTKYISKGINVIEGKGKTVINTNEENEGDKRLSDYDNYKKNKMQNKKRYQCSRGLIKPFESKVKISRAEWSLITKFLVNNSKLDKEGQKEVYFKTIENEYRGEINILVVEIGEQQINALKGLLGFSYKENRNKYSKEYKVKWNVIKDFIYNEKELYKGNTTSERNKRSVRVKQSIINYRETMNYYKFAKGIGIK